MSDLFADKNLSQLAFRNVCLFQVFLLRKPIDTTLNLCFTLPPAFEQHALVCGLILSSQLAYLPHWWAAPVYNQGQHTWALFMMCFYVVEFSNISVAASFEAVKNPHRVLIIPTHLMRPSVFYFQLFLAHGTHTYSCSFICIVKSKHRQRRDTHGLGRHAHSRPRPCRTAVMPPFLSRCGDCGLSLRMQMNIKFEGVHSCWLDEAGLTARAETGGLRWQTSQTVTNKHVTLLHFVRNVICQGHSSMPSSILSGGHIPHAATSSPLWRNLLVTIHGHIPNNLRQNYQHVIG